MAAAPPIQPLSDSPSNAANLGPLHGWSDATLLCFLMLCATLPYLNSLPNAFVHDDHAQVVSNPYIRSFHSLPQIFTTNVWSYVGPETKSNYYRPMMMLGYLVCYKLFGLNAFWFHVANVVLQALVVSMLFLVTARMFEDRAVAFVAAGVFALHPIHTEPVAWISGAPDLELAFFYLLTFWFFLGLAQPRGGRSVLMQLGTVGSYVLTLLSKEPALTLPFLATAYEHFCRNDRTETTRAQKLPRYALLWLLAVAYLLLRVHALGTFAPVSLLRLTWYEVILSAIALVVQYLEKLLWPVHLCFFCSFHKSVSLLDRGVVVGGCGLILCAVLFAYLWRRKRLASFGLLWLLVTLAPALNARWLGQYSFAERYLYLPSVGFCWVVGWGAVELWTWATTSSRGAVWRRALPAVVGVLAVLCVSRVVTRNRDWQNDVVFYTRALAASPDDSFIRGNLGAIYGEQGDLVSAERELREALKFAPDNPTKKGILINLGTLYSKLGAREKAVTFFQQAMQIAPKSVSAHVGLGFVYADMGLLEKAESQFRAAVALAPWNPTAYSGLGVVYWRMGERDRTESAFKQALSIDPTYSDAHFQLADFYAANGRIAEAVREYRAGLAINPENIDAVIALKRLISQTTDPKSLNP